jgi:NitT/TauT family transport system substrate-binding protein
LALLLSTFQPSCRHPSTPNRIVVATSQGGALGFASELIKQRGIDKKRGLAVDFRLFSPDQGELALFNRVVDAGYFGPVSAAKANLEGRAITLFGAALLNHYSIVVKPGSPIKTFDQLKGRRLGTVERYTGGYTSLATVFAVRGLDLERYCTVITGSPTALTSFLERGDVDAIILFEPQTSILTARGAVRVVATVRQLWADVAHQQPLLLLGLAAQRDWIDRNKDVASALAASYYEAFAMIREDKSVFEAEWAKKVLGIRSDQELAAVEKALPLAYPSGWDAIAVRAANLQLEKSVTLGLLRGVPPNPIFITLDKTGR